LGQNMSLGFMGFSPGFSTMSLPLNPFFVKIYVKPRLSGVVPGLLFITSNRIILMLSGGNTMNVHQKYFKRLQMVLGILFLTAALIGTVAGAGVQPAQASLLAIRTPRPTRTPTRSPTPTNTPTPTSEPYATPTPGPTTTVDGTLKIVSSPNVGTGTYGNNLKAVAVVSVNDVWAVGFSPLPAVRLYTSSRA